jgi:LPXTG-motif cell wall-anchored protein
MKHVKKIFAFALTLVMAFGFALTAYAGENEGEGGSAPTTTTTGTITINNAAKNETYEIYKVLDATISNNGGINYTGEIPSALQSVLEVQTVGTSPNTYSAIGKKADVADDVYFKAIEDYAKTTNAVDSKQADGSGKVTFNVAPGYYVVTSTQGTHVMIDSATNPASNIYEKNTKTITAKKEANGTSFSIGDTITYTATFDTTNYYGTGDTAKIVSSYEISDTLPDFLSDVSVTSITIGGNPYTTGEPATTPQFDSNKTIAIPWATKDTDGNWTSLYNNGSQIVVVYTAKLTSVTNINAADTNTVKIRPILNDGTGEDDKPWDDSWQDDAVINTYAAALKKIDGQTKAALKGAKFTIKGLNVTGGNGIYTVVSYSNAANAAESAVLDTDDNGMLYILGLDKDVDLTVTEVTAPDGYNKLTSTVTLEPQVLTTAVHKETTTVHYDAKGNIISSETTTEGGTQVTKNLEDLNAGALEVLNNKGTELPSTGGIGTTIFYVVGGVMVAGAAIFLLTKRRAAASE